MGRDHDLDLIGLVDACERLCFRLQVRHSWQPRPDGRRSNEIVEHLAVWDPDHPARRPPDRLVLPLMARARVVRGYLRRVRSPFFPDRPTEADRRAALECAIADDRRLTEHGR